MSRPSEKANRVRIRALNDEFRKTFAGGQILITPGVSALPNDVRAMAIRRIAAFDDFKTANDPHGEHDFGAIEIAGSKLFWKIDYYDLALTNGSEDAGNPDVTKRVMTIMLAEEY